MSSTATIQSPVLVLNQNYQPLNICNVRRALVLVGRGKAELIENGRGYIRSVSELFPAPSVIRLVYMVKRPVMRRRLSRQAVFYRDGFTCQYCGKQTRQLTLDHISPTMAQRPTHLGQRGQRLHTLQPSQGRPDSTRSSHEADVRA